MTIFLLASFLLTPLIALSMELMESKEPYVLHLIDGDVTISNHVYNSFECFQGKRNFDEQSNHLDFTKFYLPRCQELSEEYYPAEQLLSCQWMQKLLHPFRKQEPEEIKAYLKKYDFKELCIMLHDYQFLCLQEERLKLVMGAIVSKYIEQYKNNIVARAHIFPSDQYWVLRIALEDLPKEFKNKKFVCEEPEHFIMLWHNEYIMKFFNNLEHVDLKCSVGDAEFRFSGNIGELPIEFAFERKKIVNNCLDLTACFNGCNACPNEKGLLFLINFEGKKRQIAFAVIKKLILDKNPHLDSLSIVELCTLLPNLETISVKESQLVEMILSDEERLAIMGIQSLKPLQLKQPLTLYLGKDSHPVTLEQYRKMGSYTHVAWFYLSLMGRNVKMAFCDDLDDPGLCLVQLFCFKILIHAMYFFTSIAKENFVGGDSFSLAMDVGMVIFYGRMLYGPLVKYNTKESYVLTFFMNYLIFTRVFYDFFGGDTSQKQTIKKILMAMVMGDMIIYSPFLRDSVWPLIKAKLIDHQSFCPTIIVE